MSQRHRELIARGGKAHSKEPGIFMRNRLQTIYYNQITGKGIQNLKLGTQRWTKIFLDSEEADLHLYQSCLVSARKKSLNLSNQFKSLTLLQELLSVMWVPARENYYIMNVLAFIHSSRIPYTASKTTLLLEFNSFPWDVLLPNFSVFFFLPSAYVQKYKVSPALTSTLK